MGSETEVLETEDTSITETEIETLSEEGAGTVPVYAVDPEGGFELFVESLAGSPYGPAVNILKVLMIRDSLFTALRNITLYIFLKI